MNCKHLKPILKLTTSLEIEITVSRQNNIKFAYKKNEILNMKEIEV